MKYMKHVILSSLIHLSIPLLAMDTNTIIILKNPIKRTETNDYIAYERILSGVYFYKKTGIYILKNQTTTHTSNYLFDHFEQSFNNQEQMREDRIDYKRFLKMNTTTEQSAEQRHAE